MAPALVLVLFVTMSYRQARSSVFHRALPFLAARSSLVHAAIFILTVPITELSDSWAKKAYGPVQEGLQARYQPGLFLYRAVHDVLIFSMPLVSIIIGA